MRTLSIGERFKDARIVHNQHGKQTMSEVEAATGVSKSMISGLENDSGRDIGYTNIIALAKHYGVSIDYLLGISETRSTNASTKAIMQFTGLSEDNINHLNQLLISQNGEPFINPERTTLQMVNDFISFSRDFNIYINFFQLLKLRDSFKNAEARNGGDIEQMVAEGNAKKWGYAVLPVNESIKYYSSQLAQALGYEIAKKYAVNQTSQPRGTKRTVVINGKEITYYGE